MPSFVCVSAFLYFVIRLFEMTYSCLMKQTITFKSTHTLLCTLSFLHTHTNTHTYLSLSLSLSLIQIPLSPPFPHTHTNLPPSKTHTHPHTHTHTHHSLSFTHTYCCPFFYSFSISDHFLHQTEKLVLHFTFNQYVYIFCIISSKFNF